MSSAPVLRSAALQKSLALIPVRPPTPSTNNGFAAALSKAQARTPAPQSVTPADASGPIPYLNEITAVARKYGVDPALMAGLVKAESNFDPNATSRAGAKGLTQLMDATARGLGVTNSFDIRQSLDGGARFLGGLLKQFNGDRSLALAAYNAGPAAVQKYGGIPPYQETQRYVPKVLDYATQFQRILGGQKAAT
jgi:soluble lytic murein transglycosylase-like protein